MDDRQQAGAKCAFDLTEIQTRLAALPLYGAQIDGVVGPASRRAMEALLALEGITGWSRWSQRRLTIAARQALCRQKQIDTGPIDGLLGPQTRYAIAVYEARLNGDSEAEVWRDGAEEKPPLRDTQASAQDWPRQKDCVKFFGPPGKNQTRLSFPYPMRLAWSKRTIVRSTLCHEKVHDAAQRIFARVLDHYGETRIRTLGLDLFGGCLNVRKMRGGSAWSMHSWGIAFDFDPERNQLRWSKDRAQMAKPDYDTWFDLWEEEGAISLGRLRDYDRMHVQFARL